MARAEGFKEMASIAIGVEFEKLAECFASELEMFKCLMVEEWENALLMHRDKKVSRLEQENAELRAALRSREKGCAALEEGAWYVQEAQEAVVHVGDLSDGSSDEHSDAKEGEEGEEQEEDSVLSEVLSSDSEQDAARQDDAVDWLLEVIDEVALARHVDPEALTASCLGPLGSSLDSLQDIEVFRKLVDECALKLSKPPDRSDWLEDLELQRALRISREEALAALSEEGEEGGEACGRPCLPGASSAAALPMPATLGATGSSPPAARQAAAPLLGGPGIGSSMPIAALGKSAPLASAALPVASGKPAVAPVAVGVGGSAQPAASGKPVPPTPAALGVAGSTSGKPALAKSAALGAAGSALPAAASKPAALTPAMPGVGGRKMPTPADTCDMPSQMSTSGGHSGYDLRVTVASDVTGNDSTTLYSGPNYTSTRMGAIQRGKVYSARLSDREGWLGLEGGAYLHLGNRLLWKKGAVAALEPLIVDGITIKVSGGDAESP